MPNSEFGPDGTQAPPPPRLFPDPLAGLVTADTWTASKWSGQWSAYARSRVAVAVPPTPTEEMRRAIWAATEQEQRRPRGRGQRVAAHQQQFLPPQQVLVSQPHQPAKPANSAAALIGCLIVIGFFVLVIINILGSIFSG